MNATVSELDRLNADVAVAAPEAYVDGTLPMIVPEGMYDLVITEWDVSRNKETKAPDGKSFILQCTTTGEDGNPKPVRNLRVWTTTFQRNGVTVSGLGDLIRAIDDTATWHTIADAGRILQKAMDQRTPFRVKLTWEAFDLDYFNENGGGTMTRKSPEEKALRKLATIKGMQNFRQAPDGTYLPEVEGPSGAMLEARLVIDRYVPASKRR